MLRNLNPQHIPPLFKAYIRPHLECAVQASPFLSQVSQEYEKSETLR